MKRLFTFSMFLIFLVSTNLCAQITEQRILKDLRGKSINGQWTIMPDKEPTKVKIVSQKKDKSSLTVRIAFKANENLQTNRGKNTISTVEAVFDILYKSEKFEKIIFNSNKTNWLNNDYVYVNKATRATKTIIQEFQELDKFWDEFTNAISNNNKEKLSSLVQFPLNSGTEDDFNIKNKNDFNKYYEKLFSKKIKERILNGLIGYPISEDPEEGDLKKGDITIVSPIVVQLKSGLTLDLVFRKINGKYKLVGFYTFA